MYSLNDIFRSKLRPLHSSVKQKSGVDKGGAFFGSIVSAAGSRANSGRSHYSNFRCRDDSSWPGVALCRAVSAMIFGGLIQRDQAVTFGEIAQPGDDERQKSAALP